MNQNVNPGEEAGTATRDSQSVTWKMCRCADHSNNVAVVTTVFYDNPSQDDIAFVTRYAGRFVCFTCGGELADDVPSNYDHVTATAITMRLRALGIIPARSSPPPPSGITSDSQGGKP
jgi:hypothetical protein